MSEFKCFVCQEHLDDETDFGGFMREYDLVVGGTSRLLKLCKDCIK